MQTAATVTTFDTAHATLNRHYDTRAAYALLRARLVRMHFAALDDMQFDQAMDLFMRIVRIEKRTDQEFARTSGACALLLWNSETVH